MFNLYNSLYYHIAHIDLLQKVNERSWQSSSTKHDWTLQSCLFYSQAHEFTYLHHCQDIVAVWGLIRCESHNCLYLLLLFLSFECHLFKWVLNNIAVPSVCLPRPLASAFNQMLQYWWFTNQCLDIFAWKCHIKVSFCVFF